MKIWEILLIILNRVAEYTQSKTKQLIEIGADTISYNNRKMKLIIMRDLDKDNIRIGGPGRVVEIDESLFVRVKHNKGRDLRRRQVWVFGMYLRAAENSTKQVIFYQVEKRDAVTLLNLIYKHVLPGTKIHSDCWTAYNKIIDLDKDNDHRTVNHSIEFVARDGTHTKSIESAKIWFS
jgi:hypothetical protein